MEEETIDLAPLQDILEQYKSQRGAVIPVLWYIRRERCTVHYPARSLCGG